ncbi:hypothetical protein MMC30_009018 [Trapelia coarctata]|nr:hypothetical protein [Trapelia coarctata]
MELEGCFDSECPCPCSCHSAADEAEHAVFNNAGNQSLGVTRQGPLGFTDIPYDVRKMIYMITMRQKGEDRKSPYFKGKIDINILLTCKMIYSEARYIPLAINHIWFASPFHGVRFLRSLTLRQRKQIKDCSLDLHVSELMGSVTPMVASKFSTPLQVLAGQLTDLELNGFGLTLMGPMNAEAYNRVGYQLDFVFRFTHMKEMRVVIGSVFLSEDAKELIKRNLKNAEAPVAPVKKRLYYSPEFEQRENSKRPRIEQLESEPANTEMASNTSAAMPASISEQLLQHWERIDNYAKLNEEAYQRVHVRLPRAREFAEQANIVKYNALVASVMKTLDEFYQQQFAVLRKIRKAYNELHASNEDGATEDDEEEEDDDDDE